MVLRQSAQKENNHYFEYRFHNLIGEPEWRIVGLEKCYGPKIYAWRKVQKHGNSLCLTKIEGFFRPN